MCGINLIVDKHKSLDSGTIKLMSELTEHRGPDETKISTFENSKVSYLAACNRLKISDSSDAAAQPFVSSDSRFVLLFNGEVYNYQALKNELINNSVNFSSHSDTEVLFHWLRLNGKSGIEKLEGMFAFVFIDTHENDILIARDRFGIKPIYYYEDDKCFIVSSEIKSVLGTGLIKKEINTRQVHHYLSYKYASQPETLYQNIHELTHGSVLHFQKNNWHKERYFQAPKVNISAVPSLTSIEEMITDSLVRQLHAKVPLGLLLSGGVDSTLLLALARKEGFTLPTYSIVNSKSDASFGTKDYQFSRMAAAKYNSDHLEVEIAISILDQFEDFIDSMDQPIGDSSYLMTSEICKNASKSMKVLLSGAGADEYFAGYNRHFAFYKYLKNKTLLDSLFPLFKPLLNSLPTGIPHPFRKQFKLIKKWSKSYNESPLTMYQNYITFSDFNVNGDDKEFYNTHSKNQDLVEWSLNHDQNNYLIGDVLALSDKASMQHGVELRIPYLDEKLANYLSGIPQSSLLKNGQKWILKELLKKHGGQKFINRPKEGFGLPLSNWLFDKRISHLWELFESKGSVIFNYLEKTKFDNLVKQQKQRSEDHGPLLWSILVLGHWMQRNF